MRRFSLAHDFPGVIGPVVLGLMPRQLMVHRAQSSCSLHGQNVREGTGASVQYALNNMLPLVQLLLGRPHLSKVPPSPSSTAVWKAGLNTDLLEMFRNPNQQSEKSGDWFLGVSLSFPLSFSSSTGSSIASLSMPRSKIFCMPLCSSAPPPHVLLF